MTPQEALNLGQQAPHSKSFSEKKRREQQRVERKTRKSGKTQWRAASPAGARGLTSYPGCGNTGVSSPGAALGPCLCLHSSGQADNFQLPAAPKFPPYTWGTTFQGRCVLCAFGELLQAAIDFGWGSFPLPSLGPLYKPGQVSASRSGFRLT